MNMRASWRPALLSGITAAALLAGASVRAADKHAESGGRISDDAVRIGLILDLSGPYSGVTGIGSATAAKMAAEDFGGRGLGAPIEIMVADHEKSSGRALEIDRDWSD